MQEVDRAVPCSMLNRTGMPLLLVHPVAAVAGRGSLSRFQRFSGRLGIIRRRFAFQSPPLQQRLDVRIAPDKILEQTQRIGRTTATEQCLPEAIAILALQSAVFLNPFHTVGIEHFTPDVRVISGGISSGKSVREIRAAITRRYRRKIDPSLAQRRRFKSHCILGYFWGIELVPGLIEQ